MIKMEYLIELSVRGVAQWLARLLWEQDVAGSTPAIPTIFLSKKWSMKPEKASLHAPKVRFMARSAASYAVRRASYIRLFR